MQKEISKTEAIVTFLVCSVPIIGLIYIFIRRKNWILQNFVHFLLFAVTSLSLKIVVTFFTRDFWIVTAFYVIHLLIIISFVMFKKRRNIVK
ncbi:hypothetical protein AT267_09195 [Bacillus cereus]|nr:hypothetical protein AT267_09195 [Bacillus cereus]